MIRFIAPDAPPPEPVHGTVVVGATGVILPPVVGCTAQPAGALEADETRILELRLEGFTMQEIAEQLACTRARISRVLRRLRANGHLKDVELDLADTIAPLAVEKLAEKLEGGEYPAIRDTLRGLGLFRTYAQRDTQATHRSLDLRVEFTMPTDRPPLELNPANIVGRPREARGHGQDADPIEGQENHA